MNDTDIYADRHRAPDPPPIGPADTGLKHATTGGQGFRPPLRNRGDAT